MAEDWAADVRKNSADADSALIAGIVRHCGIALQKRDSSLVSFTDKNEVERLRTNFSKKETRVDGTRRVAGQGHKRGRGQAVRRSIKKQGHRLLPASRTFREIVGV